MTATWAGAVVAALVAAGMFIRWSNRLAALLERLTIATERHDRELAERRAVDERQDADLAQLRALNGRPGRRVP